MEGLKHFLNMLSDPAVFLTISVALFLALLRWYRVVTRPAIAGGIGFLMFAMLVFGACDENLVHNALGKPDNIPIPLMLATVAFFTWLALRRAAINDERAEKGLPPAEAEEAGKKVYTWPDLVYSEFICLLLVSALLLVWALVLKAPLEPPASASKTPNPAKAPWYFLALQEMLVYFDPWLAGVVLPGLIVVGLMAIPYLDPNPKGNGYYTLAERKFAVPMFLFGFLILWVVLILYGAFLRGPNWNFFGPFEKWDAHKVVALTNVDLSEYVWIRWLGRPLPSEWYIREAPGLLLLGGYFAAIPPLLAATKLRPLFVQLGFLRYNLLMHLALFMALLPIKMVLRWTVNLKYLVAIQNYNV
jgi:hypothetical protein